MEKWTEQVPKSKSKKIKSKSRTSRKEHIPSHNVQYRCSYWENFYDDDSDDEDLKTRTRSMNGTMNLGSMVAS